MIRKLLTISIMAGALSLAGCAGQIGLPDPAIPPVASSGSSDALVQKIKDGAAQVCGYVPTTTTILRILETFAPSAAGAIELGGVVVNGICGALAAPKAVRLGKKRLVRPVYRGVVISGKRV